MAVERNPTVEPKELEKAISWFYTALIGLSLRELMTPVGPELREHGPTFDVLAMGLTFLIVTFRFWLGNQLHLIAIRDEMRFVVLWDAAFIMLEGMIILYLAGLGTPERSETAVKSGVGFMGILTILCIVDCLWILSIRLSRDLGELGIRIRRSARFVPWGWFWLNVALAVVYVLLWKCFKDSPNYYRSPWFVGALFGFNVAAGITDLMLIHHYMGGLFDERTEASNG